MEEVYQTRSESHGLALFGTLKDALDHAREYSSVWKISFDAINGERIRLVRDVDNCFVLDPILYLPPVE